MKKFIFINIFWIHICSQLFSQGFTEIAKVLPEPNIQNIDDYYGKSISIDGNLAVVGSPGYERDKGCAVVMKYIEGKWEKVAILRASGGKQGDMLGCSVDISGNNIVVGAYGGFDNLGSVYVYTKPTEGWVNMEETAKLSATVTDPFYHYGYSVSISGNNIVVGDPIHEVYSGVVYIFSKPSGGWTNMTQTAKLTASDGESSDQFGYSVSLSGNNIVAGAPKDNSSKGSAYVFTMPSGGWIDMTETAKLTYTSPNNYLDFGNSVSISGDNILVGSPDDHAGKAFLFTKPLSGWISATQNAKLTATDGENDDYFGCSVALSGDNAIIGAIGSDGKGAGYLFTKPTGGWVDTVETAKLTASDSDSNNSFGAAVSISLEHVMIGAFEDDDNLKNSGSVYHFKKPESGWVDSIQNQKILDKVYKNASYDLFGRSVCIDGEYAVIGAPGYMSNRGCAYILNYINNQWEKIAMLTSSDAMIGDKFGSSVSIMKNQIVVGAPASMGKNGSAYVFTKPSNGWANATQDAKLTASGYNGYEYLGNSVDIWGDDIVVGTCAEGEYTIYTGSTYVFSKPASGWVNATETAILKTSDWDGYQSYINIVSINDNYIAMSMYTHSVGAVYLYKKPSNGWTNMTETAKLIASGIYNNDDFGCSVDLSENYCVVGARMGNYDKGVVLVYQKPENGWQSVTQIATLTASDGEKYDSFGRSVSISGDQIIVGAWSDDETNTNGYGSAYLFNKPEGGWIDTTQTAKLIASDGFDYAFFGAFVSISGNNILVSPYWDNDEGESGGAAYFYKVDKILHSNDELIEDQIKIYPNPTNSSFKILIPQLNAYTLNVYDIAGQLVFTKQNLSSEEEIELTELTNGIYMIHLYNKNKKYIKRIVKI